VKSPPKWMAELRRWQFSVSFYPPTELVSVAFGPLH